MRHYPRDAKSRLDALLGSSKSGDHGPVGSNAMKKDRLLMFKPGTVTTNIKINRGGDA